MSAALDSERIEALRSDLEPVHRALLADAAWHADDVIAAATASAAATVDQATRAAERSVEDAVAQRRATAAAANEQLLAHTRQQVAVRIRTAQRDAHQRLVDTTREAFLSLREEASYASLLDRLAELAQAQLGPEAEITRDPVSVGGVVATDGSRLVDYTLPALADRALDALADQVSQVWA